ncbi:MAG: DUF1559 domain-containing protein [Pirellulales bacterium]|nr:DUF1559 domain-containing protein [Pirellulales bacterium]
MRCRWMAAVALLIGGSGQLLAQEAGATKPRLAPLDLHYIPGDAIAAAVVQPHRMLTSPQTQWWPTEILSALGKKEFGFDPLEVEQAIGIVSLPRPGAGNPLGCILKFRAPLNAEAVAAKIVPRGKEEKIDGHRAVVGASEYQPSVAFPDDRTAVLATRENLAVLLAAKPGEDPLHKLLKSADGSPDVAVYFVIEPIRPMLVEALPMMQHFAPEGLKDLFDLPMTVDTAKLTANLKTEGGDGVVFDLTLGTRDAETAGNVAAVIERGFRAGRALLLAQISEDMEKGSAEDLEIKVAAIKYVERLSDGILAAMGPKATGNQVAMHADVQIGTAQWGMLASLLMPAIQASREAAHRNASQNNLKQIALGLLNYADKHKHLPAVANFDKQGKPLLSWRVHLLPEAEEAALYKEFHLDEPWDSDHNKKLIDRMPAVYKHPKLHEVGKTVYLAVVGEGAAFEGNDGLSLQNFTDGTSNTIMVVEVAPEKAVPWTKPEDWEFDPEKDVDVSEFGGLWEGGIFNAVFVDGHVAALTNFIEPELLKKLITRAGGEVVQAL